MVRGMSETAPCTHDGTELKYYYRETFVKGRVKTVSYTLCLGCKGEFGHFNGYGFGYDPEPEPDDEW